LCVSTELQKLIFGCHKGMQRIQSAAFKDFSAAQEISAMYLLTKRDNSVAHNISADVRQESPEEQIEALRTFLGYPKLEQKYDRANRDYWYLRPGSNVEEAESTAPIAVRFYDDLESKQKETYKHYLGRNVLEDKPVMYLLLPNGDDGKVSLVLPTEGGLKQRIASRTPETGDFTCGT
jgi:hypothetical protein